MRFSILKAGTTPRRVRERLGDYGQLFTDLLAEPGQQWDIHDVEHGEFPSDIAVYDGFVITGSPASAYDDTPWVRELLAHIRRIHDRNIPLLGICFGAQTVAQALDGEVGPNPQGWDLGVVELSLTEQGRAVPALSTAPNPLRILQTHKDIVTRMPAGAVLLASSARTPYEIFSLGQTVLCLQGHPELDNESIRELVEKRAEQQLFPPQRAQEGLESLREFPHQDFFQRWLRAFVREGRLLMAA